ncbi:MAG: MotA/TolQ/ExbB proton channel family protein [Nitrospira sp.]|nr:MotA/TolQ/ExbB proton channel family protein [Nitrospira sp.]
MFPTNPLELLGSLGTISIIVLLILLVFSVLSWGIILYKWRMFRLIKIEERQFLQAYQEEDALSEKELHLLQHVAVELPNSPSGSVLLEVLSRVEPLAGHNPGNVAVAARKTGPWPDRQYLEKVVQYLIQQQIARQEAYLPFLATTGNITPFIGLLGTVVGVINAFQQIGIEGTASIASVAPGLSEALLATAAGLFAAIPAVIGYNFYLAQIRKTIFGVEAFSIEFLNALDAPALAGTRGRRRS